MYIITMIFQEIESSSLSKFVYISYMFSYYARISYQ